MVWNVYVIVYPSQQVYVLERTNCSHGETARFVYTNGLRVKRKQKHVLCKPKTCNDIWTETASYKVLPLGNNVYNMNSICFLICCPSITSDSLAFYFQRTSNAQIRPDSIKWITELYEYHFVLLPKSVIIKNEAFFSVALQSLKDAGRFLMLFRHMVGLLGRVISPSQGLYLHRTTQYRKTRTNIHALSGIQTHDPSNQPAKTHAADRKATVTGKQ
jgi:hypothetical protein